MSLPKKAEYNDLLGDETASILAARFWQFMESIPEFQKRFALTRVKLRLEIAVEIWGASPPKRIHHDEIEMVATNPLPSTYEKFEVRAGTTEEVNAFDNPPDQVREEHGLPVHRGQRNQQTGFMENVPVILEGSEAKFPPAPKPSELPPPPQAQPITAPNPATLPSPMSTDKIWGYKQKRPFAAVVELDRGSLQRGDRDNAPVLGGEKFASTIMSQEKSNVVMPQPDFLARDSGRGVIDPQHLQAKVQEAAHILSEHEQAFNRATDGAQIWSSREGDGGKP